MMFDELEQGLKTSFFDKNHKSDDFYQTKLVTNNGFDEKVIKTFESELATCTSFWFTTAFLSMSGLSTLLSLLEDLERRNIPGRILVSQYLNFTQPEALKRLKAYSNLEVRIETCSDLHSKIYLFEHQNHTSVLVGSSNLTANALSKNEEMNIFMRALPESKVISELKLKKQTLFNAAQEITDEYLHEYSEIYKAQKKLSVIITSKKYVEIQPNSMQEEALICLKELRKKEIKKALLISATGTGKTYLSAFDVKSTNAKSMLFIVHLENILLDAQKTFQSVFGPEFSSTIFSGTQKEIDGHQYIFATIQTLSKSHNLELFKPDTFDYIVIDESHRSGSKSYLKILEYFKPKFLLGMTATPERTDGFDIFKSFDYNIAYEIRLQKAMECDLIAPFHYFGISDLEVNGELIDDKTEFKYLVSHERIRKIKEASDKYGTDNGELRALVFCSNVEESNELAVQMTLQGIKSIALSGKSTIEQREQAITSISSNDPDRIKMIYTVDIFNEGVDIPRINQVIFLRSTESSIIYVQQLGRGLRKTENKEYLTVIDFIGNYAKNFLVPMALFGDSSYNKDNLRKLVKSGSSALPGSSTIHFDEVAKERIFASISHSNFEAKKELIQDYKYLFNRLGQMPMMMDFITADVRDPYSYVLYSKSYYSFLKSIEKDSSIFSLTEIEEELLKFFSLEINNTKRVFESLLIRELITSETQTITVADFEELIYGLYNIKLSKNDLESIAANLNMEFSTPKFFEDGHMINSILIENGLISLTTYFSQLLENNLFYKFLLDNTLYSIDRYSKDFSLNSYNSGFLYYAKYGRKDVCRILNWKKNEAAVMYGYKTSSDSTNCPIFVTYHKDDEISDSTKYEDHFIDNEHFHWMSKSRRKISSKDVQSIIHAEKTNTLLPLFVKKDDDEGVSFYFIGLLTYIENSAEEVAMQTEKDSVSAVKMKFKIDRPVDINLYNYLTSK